VLEPPAGIAAADMAGLLKALALAGLLREVVVNRLLGRADFGTEINRQLRMYLPRFCM
jgi:hypothetical protein